MEKQFHGGPVRTGQSNIDIDNVLTFASEITRGRELETFLHENRTAELAVALGRRFYKADDDLLLLAKGATVHDIGKLLVPTDILNKPGRVNPYEYEILQQHVDHGLKLVEPLDLPVELVHMIAMHHERLDGSGYPQRLKNGEIPLHARIAAVADITEAMTADRPYRRGLEAEVVLTLVEAQAGLGLDSEVVGALREIVDRRELSWLH